MLAAVLTSTLFVGAGVALAVDGSEPGRAGVLRVDEARADRELLTVAIREAALEVTELRDELAELEARTAELSIEQASLVSEVETSVRQNRELVVAAFITGGVAEYERLLGSNRASDYQWQTYLLETEAVQVTRVSDRLEALRTATDTEVLDLAERLDSRKSRLAVAEQRLAHHEAEVPGADLQLLLAEAWAFSDRSVVEGRYGEAPSESWERLRFCESSGNYRAVDPSGIYRGAYQFDRQTWRTVGGSGDPINASPSEQDARARALYALRGNQPWPVCGHYLP
ncbi:MAG: transglycosylase family protein [Acidimicrobiales bacterium]